MLVNNASTKVRGGKIGPIRWASSTLPKLGSSWAIKLLARKKSGQIWLDPVWPSPIWSGPPEFFFALKRLFGRTDPIFRAGWTVKILAQKNRTNFDTARFWPGLLLARPSPTRPARLPPLTKASEVIGKTKHSKCHKIDTCYLYPLKSVHVPKQYM